MKAYQYSWENANAHTYECGKTWELERRLKK